MKDVQCKKCRYLLKDKDGYNWCPNKTFVDDPDIDLIRNCEWYAVKTNADRIRSMTDEELAEYLFERGNADEYCYGICIHQDDIYACVNAMKQSKCIQGVIAWLKQECDS